MGTLDLNNWRCRNCITLRPMTLRLPPGEPLRLLYPFAWQSIETKLERLRPQMPFGCGSRSSDEQVCCRPARYRLTATTTRHTTSTITLLIGHVRPAILASQHTDTKRCSQVDVPFVGTSKPQSNGLLYSNTVISTLAVDGWAVTFVTARRGLGGLRPRPVPSSLYQM